jgi:hypothetical protein
MIESVTIMPMPAGETPGVMVKEDLSSILDLGQQRAASRRNGR